MSEGRFSVSLRRFFNGRWRPALICSGLVFCEALVIFANYSTPIGILLESCVVVFGFLAIRWPRLWLVASTLTLALFFDDGLTSSASIFVLVLAVLDLLGNGRIRLGWTVVTAAHATFAVSFLVFPDLPIGFYLLLSFLIVIAASSGSVMHAATVRGEADRLTRLAQRQNERFQLSRSMHDALASSMSHVVLLARSLELDNLSESASEKANLIRKESQQALVDLRDMMGALRTTDDLAMPPTSHGSLSQEWEESLAALRTHGFEVVDNFAVTAVVTGSEVLELLLIGIRELTTNIIRHGDSHKAVNVELYVTEQAVRLLVSNATKENINDALLPSSGYGLESLRERAAAFNGEVSTVQVDLHWVTSLHIPVVRQGVA